MMKAPGQLVLMVLVLAKLTVLGAEALAGEDIELSQQTGLTQEDDSQLPHDMDDAELIYNGDDPQSAGSTQEDLPERVAAIETGDILFPDEYRPVGGDFLVNGVEESKSDNTLPSTTQPASRLDIDEAALENSVKDSGVPRCYQEKESGMCRAYIPSWYYDFTSATCQEFIYGGCGGNDNNFGSEEDCQAACPDVVLCPEDPSKTCNVSESACMNATCSDQLDVICHVTPCTCDILFFDFQGHQVLCDEPTVPPTIPGAGVDGDAGDKAPQDKDDTDTSGSWKVPTLVAVGIVALVGAVIVTWVVLRRRSQQAGIHYTAAPSGKPSQHPQSSPGKMPDQCSV